MADDKPRTDPRDEQPEVVFGAPKVTVRAIQEHTCNGEAYHVGDTYEVDEQLADSVAAQGKAVRVTGAAVVPEPAAPPKKK